MRFRMLAALGLAAILVGGLHADLTRARAEQNREKRSGLALENAEEQYQLLRTAYQKGESAHVEAAVAEILESVNLAYESLVSTGKDPRRSPKWFKRAEIQTRDLLRKLTSFQQEMNFEERPLLEPVRTRIQKVHDELLLGLMEGKRK